MTAPCSDRYLMYLHRTVAMTDADHIASWASRLPKFTNGAIMLR